MVIDFVFLFYIIAGIIFSGIFLLVSYLVLSIISIIVIRVPYVNTPIVYVRKIIPELGISSQSVIYDLGCGNGDFMLEALKHNPKLCVGFEISPTAYISAVAHTFLKDKGKIVLKLKNFLQADLSQADIVYVYLVPTAIVPLGEKFKKELKSGAKFVCIGSPMPGWTPEKEITLKGDYKAYLYKNI